MNVYEVGKYIGHKKASTTMGYVKVDQEKAFEAVKQKSIERKQIFMHINEDSKEE